jgi:hypothetical protein
VAPQVTGFDLDMSGNRLTIHFSEMMRADTLRTMVDTIELRPSIEAGGVHITDKSDLVDLVNSDSLTLKIGIDDANALKLHSTVARTADTTVLGVAFDTVRDMNENAVEARVLNVDIFNPDTVAPVPIAFSADLNAAQLFIEFDETVNAATLVPQKLTLKSSAAGTVAYTLRGGEAFGSSGTNISLQLAKPDLDQINLRAMFTGTSDSVLMLASDAIQDTSVAATGSVQKTLTVSGFVADTTAPSLTGFSFNLTSRKLMLVFDEIVDADTITPSAIMFQPQALGDSGLFHNLRTAEVLTPNGLKHELLLSIDDVNAIKQKEGLLDSSSTSYLSCSEALAKDMAGNAVNSVSQYGDALPASPFVDDSVRPQLLKFDLNMDAATLTLYFSEVVDSSL